MIRLLPIVLAVALGLTMALSVGTAGQTTQDVCNAVQNDLRLPDGVASTLCADLTAGIDRGHLTSARALGLLQAVGARLSGATQAAATSLLTTIGTTVSPATNDLPAELLISRVLGVFAQSEDAEVAMTEADREVDALHQTLTRVAQVYADIDIDLAPNVQSKIIRTEFGDVSLTVGRVDTVITATALALDRFERRLDRSLDDVAGMESAVVNALARPSFAGAESLSNALLQYVDAQTDGGAWAPIVRALADARGRDNES